jgi:predicted RNase H-like HicB family nuclease
MKIEFTSQVFKEGRMFVAHSPELDISSCATTERKALENLQEAVRLFLEEAERKGSLKQILKEAGFSRRQQTLIGPKLIHTKRITMPLTLAHAQA